jgi:type IV pilus assembly protein PilF
MTSPLAGRLLTHGVLVPTALCLGLVGCASKATQQDDDPLGLDPQDSPASLYVEMAEEYYNRGQTEVAFRHAQQAIEADKNYPKAHVWLAFMYEEMGKPDLAATHYDRALQLAPNNSEVLYAFGAYRCRQKRYAEADVYLKKALDNPLYATPWVAMTNAGTCASSAGDAIALRWRPTRGSGRRSRNSQSWSSSAGMRRRQRSIWTATSSRRPCEPRRRPEPRSSAP